MAVQLNWKGDGSEINPFIVESTNGLVQAFRIKNSNLFISLKNCTLDHVIFDRCKNLLISQSSFNQLVLMTCSNFIIDNCAISDLTIWTSKRNHLRNCSISKISTHLWSRKNIYEDCQLGDESIDAITKGTVPVTSVAKIIPFIILTLGLALSYLIFDALVFPKKFELIDLIGIIIVGSVFIFGVLSWIIVLLTKKHLPNKIISEKDSI